MPRLKLIHVYKGVWDHFADLSIHVYFIQVRVYISLYTLYVKYQYPYTAINTINTKYSSVSVFFFVAEIIVSYCMEQ